MHPQNWDTPKNGQKKLCTAGSSRGPISSRPSTIDQPLLRSRMDRVSSFSVAARNCGSWNLSAVYRAWPTGSSWRILANGGEKTEVGMNPIADRLCGLVRVSDQYLKSFQITTNKPAIVEPLVERWETAALPSKCDRQESARLHYDIL